MILTLKLILTQKTRLGSDNASLTVLFDFYRKNYALPACVGLGCGCVWPGGFYEATERTWDLLCEHPFSGKNCDCIDERLQGLQRCMVGSPFQIYQVFYRVDSEIIQVVRVLHGSRDIAAILLTDTK